MNGSAPRTRPPVPMPRRSTSTANMSRRSPASLASAAESARPIRHSERREPRSGALIQIAGEKPRHGVERAMGIEIFMAAVEETHDVLWLVGELEHLLAHRIRDGAIEDAMHDHQWRRYLADALVGMKLILHEETHRQVPIVPRADGFRRGEGRFENDAADRLFRRQRHGDAAAERLAQTTICDTG